MAFGLAVRDVHAPVDDELLRPADLGRLDGVLEQIPVVDDPIHAAGGTAGDDFDPTFEGPGHRRHAGRRSPELGMRLGDGAR
jgi:hypothetical protein